MARFKSTKKRLRNQRKRDDFESDESCRGFQCRFFAVFLVAFDIVVSSLSTPSFFDHRVRHRFFRRFRCRRFFAFFDVLVLFHRFRWRIFGSFDVAFFFFFDVIDFSSISTLSLFSPLSMSTRNDDVGKRRKKDDCEAMLPRYEVGAHRFSKYCIQSST